MRLQAAGMNPPPMPVAATLDEPVPDVLEKLLTVNGECVGPDAVGKMGKNLTVSLNRIVG